MATELTNVTGTERLNDMMYATTNGAKINTV